MTTDLTVRPTTEVETSVTAENMEQLPYMQASMLTWAGEKLDTKKL